MFTNIPSKMTMCPVETTGFEGFTPRSQHSMAYDSAKDMVYITGGSSSRSRWMWDLLTFSFGMSIWTSLGSSFLFTAGFMYQKKRPCRTTRSI